MGAGKEPLAEDAILIRGPASEVDRAVTEIKKIVKDAENNEIDSSYVRSRSPLVLTTLHSAVVLYRASSLISLATLLGVSLEHRALVSTNSVKPLTSGSTLMTKLTIPRVNGRRRAKAKRVLRRGRRSRLVELQSPTVAQSRLIYLVQITGRKANVDEAKKRILAQVEKFVSCRPLKNSK